MKTFKNLLIDKIIKSAKITKTVDKKEAFLTSLNFNQLDFLLRNQTI